MELDLYSKAGAKSGTVTVDEDIFGITPNEHVMWLAVNAYLANQRQGNHSTKTRSEVAGSTRKLFRQKGTGRARQGDIKSGLHPGGGIIHGPKPHRYTKTLSRQVKQLARRSALSDKAKSGKIFIVEDLGLSTSRTKQVQDILNAMSLGKRQALLLTNGYDEHIYRSGRNIPTLSVKEAALASTYDIWKTRALIIERSALEVIQQTFDGGLEMLEVEHIALPTTQN